MGHAYIKADHPMASLRATYARVKSSAISEEESSLSDEEIYREENARRKRHAGDMQKTCSRGRSTECPAKDKEENILLHCQPPPSRSLNNFSQNKKPRVVPPAVNSVSTSSAILDTLPL